MSGKSPELLALEQCLPKTVEFLSGGIVDLRWFGGKLIESDLITRQAVDAALERQGGMEKASQLMKAVVTQVTFDDACFARFLNILQSEGALKALGKKFTGKCSGCWTQKKIYFFFKLSISASFCVRDNVFASSLAVSQVCGPHRISGIQ